MSENGEPWIQLDLGERGGGLLTFDTADDLRAWLNTEHERFEWLTRVPTFQRSAALQYASSIRDSLRKSINANLQQIIRGEQSGAARNNIEAALKSHYIASQHVLYSESPDGRYVLERSLEDPERAAYLYAHLLQSPNQVVKGENSVTFYAALAEVEAYRLNTRGVLKSVQHAVDGEVRRRDHELAALAEQAKTGLAEGESAAVRSRRTFLKWYRRARREFARRTTRIDYLHENRLDEIEADNREQLKNTRDALEALTETYTEFMKLRAPVKYWRRKRNFHRISATAWTALPFLVMLILWLCMPDASQIGETLESAVLVLRGLDFPPLTIAGAALAGLGLLAWFLRILIKLIMSNLHLADDAHERAVIIETFLAFVQDEKVTAEDRATILGSIFRTTPSGLVAGESFSPPTSVAEALARLGSGK